MHSRFSPSPLIHSDPASCVHPPLATVVVLGLFFRTATYACHLALVAVLHPLAAAAVTGRLLAMALVLCPLATVVFRRLLSCTPFNLHRHQLQLPFHHSLLPPSSPQRLLLPHLPTTFRHQTTSFHPTRLPLVLHRLPTCQRSTPRNHHGFCPPLHLLSMLEMGGILEQMVA